MSAGLAAFTLFHVALSLVYRLCRPLRAVLREILGRLDRDISYVIGAIIVLYLKVFVLIAQLFMKIPALKALAPVQSEPPFLATQVVVMLIFIVLGVLAAKVFSVEAAQAV